VRFLGVLSRAPEQPTGRPWRPPRGPRPIMASTREAGLGACLEVRSPGGGYVARHSPACPVILAGGQHPPGHARRAGQAAFPPACLGARRNCQVPLRLGPLAATAATAPRRAGARSSRPGPPAGSSRSDHLETAASSPTPARTGSGLHHPVVLFQAVARFQGAAPPAVIRAVFQAQPSPQAPRVPAGLPPRGIPGGRPAGNTRKAFSC